MTCKYRDAETSAIQVGLSVLDKAIEEGMSNQEILSYLFLHQPRVLRDHVWQTPNCIIRMHRLLSLRLTVPELVRCDFFDYVQLFLYLVSPERRLRREDEHVGSCRRCQWILGKIVDGLPAQGLYMPSLALNGRGQS